MEREVVRLLRKWLKDRQMSHEALGRQCPTPKTKGAIDKILLRKEGDPEMRLDTLSNLVDGLGVPGATPELRLARFFLGPNPTAEDVASLGLTLPRSPATERALQEMRSLLEAAEREEQRLSVRKDD